MNDDVWIPNLMKRGVSRRDAGTYFNMGCVEIMLGAKQSFWHGAGSVSFPSLVRETIFDSMSDPAVQTFDTFFHHFLGKIGEIICKAKDAADRYYQDTKDRFYDPFGSCLIEGCLEKGKDMFQGGPVLPGCFPIGGAGLGTAVDSLTSIKAFVFAQGKLTLHQLNSCLEDDFRGNEKLRSMLENRTICFGNDSQDADDIAAKILGTYTNAVQCLNNSGCNGQFISSLFSYTSQVSHGETVGATPNGRHAGMPVSDNAGPSQGKDTGGPTRLLNSMAKLPLDEVTGAYAMNVKIDAGILKEDSGQTAFKSLIKTHFQEGGIQLQINCVDQITLVDAQKHPEQHQNLIVRVAGFSEYFCNLDRDLQNEIISRMTHEFLGQSGNRGLSNIKPASQNEYQAADNHNE